MLGKVILVTGATSGIGRATALHCAGLGAKVVSLGRRTELGQSLVAEIERAGGEALYRSCDVTKEHEVDAAVEEILESMGRLDYAFNNAGIFLREPALDSHDSSIWEEVLKTNLTSVYYCMRAEVRAMRHTKSEKGEACVIVNNASVVAHRGASASGLAYTVAKHGVLGLTRQAAVEYAREGIRVNAVSPGPTLTEATAKGLDLPESAKQARLDALNPTGRLVAVEHIAQAVAYLCSEAASMINGQDIPLDGGQLAQL